MKLDELSSSVFWQTLSDGDVVPFTIVLPTGRAQDSITPHMALSTDALAVPEIVLAVDQLSRKARLKAAQVRTILDIDFCEEQQSGGSLVHEDNLLVIGSADVNIAAAALLEKVESYEILGAGFTKPYEYPAILGAQGVRYMFTAFPRIGLLAMYQNPWTDKCRIVLLCAGLFAVGSIAALRLLLEYLGGKEHGNNRYNDDLPLKIVDGIPRIYRQLKLKPVDECVPPMDVSNVVRVDIRE